MRRRTYSENEKQVALAYLSACKGDLKAAAKKAGVAENALQYWRDHGIEDVPELTLARERVTVLEMADGRPMPPEALADESRHPDLFQPAPDVTDWIQRTFVADGAPLYNEDHWHLAMAQIGVLWTNVPNSRQMRAVAGTAEIPRFEGNKWTKTRAEIHMTSLFGAVPDFLITLDAVYCATIDDATWCALIEHEMYHCAQAKDVFGAPQFTKRGVPKFTIRGHDCEEFAGVVRRYGVGAAAGGTAELVAAAARRPLIAEADISKVCGTCSSAL